jgi:hypothetical protein
MRARKRMRRSLCGGDTFEYRHHRWSMPRLAIESTAKLIANSIHFRHSGCAPMQKIRQNSNL